MADTIHVDLVSPERKLLAAEAREVHIPGTDGDLTAMADHAPLITTLRPGVLRVVAQDGTHEFAVTGGFAQIGPEGISVLAERALPRAEMTREVLTDWVEEARRARDEAQPDFVDSAAKLMADMVAMGTHMGLDPVSRAPAP